jgi:hypothetical protein
MFDAVEHFVHSSGYDNGQVSPPEYDLSDSSTALDYYNVSLEGSLQYVSSVATLTSSQDEDVIEVFLDSAAAASDAYGYGKGTAMGESSYRAQFTLQNPLQVQLSGYIETSKCMDGGDLRPYITLADATGTLLYYGYAPGDLSWTAELPAGTYTFSGYAWSTVSISGGGDAYPCANATAYAFFERLY